MSETARGWLVGVNATATAGNAGLYVVHGYWWTLALVVFSFALLLGLIALREPV